jgi:hypothetical protein
MNQARCSHCRERFYIGSTRPRGLRCPFCRARLEAAPPVWRGDRPALPFALTPLPSAAAGTYEERTPTYRSIGAFIGERRQRLYSRERDMGLRWREGTAIYRAAWVEDTGELYLVQLGTPDEGGGHVELLAAGLKLEELEPALAGWREAQDGGDRSLDWLRDRVRRLLAGEGDTGRPPRRPPSLRRLNRPCVDSAAGDHPRDHGVRIPHLTGAELVATQHGSPDPRDHVEHAPRALLLIA